MLLLPFALVMIIQTPLEITVRTNEPSVRISPTLYGVFFEEINHAGDGGLYAELVRNRNFTPGEPGWSVDPSTAATTLFDRQMGWIMETSHSTRIVNGGYWGIGVQGGAMYQLTVHGKCGSGMRAWLEAPSGERIAETRLLRFGKSLEPIRATLKPSRTEPKARLVLQTETACTIELTSVSLVPVSTYKGHGMRRDLAEMLAAIKPAFMRFPGGCYVEGDRITNCFRWKDTLGDITKRPGHHNDVWHYASTDGLGYHEYLQLAEDIGAESMFVVNCGLAHKDVVPMEQLTPWLQDALDAIEYARGPTSTTWGALRARAGHPKPFRLRWVEIGNENGNNWGTGGTNAEYADRYEVLYNAIKGKHPGVTTISNVPVSHPMELVDEHYYNSPAWFWANKDRYDSYPRNGPKIYVGEYAVTQDCGLGNLRAALAEAAFMTGMERNSDVVTMSSYAPLFVNVNDRRWNPDLICFDSLRCYGTPSYYVQKLFAENRPDVILPVSLSEPSAPVESGLFGLGTWNTQAEFKDAEVTGDRLAQIRPAGGTWTTSDGLFSQMAPGDDRRALFSMKAIQDGTIRLKARKIGGTEGFLIMFRAHDDKNYYWWNIGGWGNREHAIERVSDGAKYQISPHVAGGVQTNRWYDIRIDLQGRHIRCYLDDKLIHDIEERPLPTIAAVAGRYDKSGDIVVKVINGTGTPRLADLNLGIAIKGIARTVLAGNPGDENSLDQPIKVAPRTDHVPPQSKVFTFEPNSLTILRIKTR